MTEFAMVLTTAGSEAEAERIAEALVVEKLAACVQLAPIKSRYVWKGELRRDDEVLLLIKARRSAFARLAERIRALHSYETPEIVMLDIAAGDADYLAWLGAQTRT